MAIRFACLYRFWPIRLKISRSIASHKRRYRVFGDWSKLLPPVVDGPSRSSRTYRWRQTGRCARLKICGVGRVYQKFLNCWFSTWLHGKIPVLPCSTIRDTEDLPINSRSHKAVFISPETPGGNRQNEARTRKHLQEPKVRRSKSDDETIDNTCKEA